MFKYIVLAALIACAAASGDEASAEVKVLTSDVRADGFNYDVLTSNKIALQASGDEKGNQKGSYEYVAPGGELIKVEYVADENGYQPKSDLLPTPPPIPEAILKSLELIRANAKEQKKL